MERFLACQNKASASLHASGAIDGEICDSLNSRCRVYASRRIPQSRSVVGKAEARRVGMLPLQKPERTHFLTRIEVDLLAIQDDRFRDIVVELAESEIALIEDCPVAVDDLHRIDAQSCSTGQGDI